MVTLADATPQQRRAVELLLGRAPGRGSSLTVSLDEVDAVVRRAGLHSDGLAGAVIVLSGPVKIAAEVRAAADAAWRRAEGPLEVLARDVPIHAPWFADASRGLFRKVCGSPTAAEPVLSALAVLLRMLPADGVALAQLASVSAGDAHALDPGRPLSTLALSAIRATWWTGDSDVRSPAALRRALWSHVGVIVDDLSSTVLTLNLRPSAGTALAAFVGAASALGEPVWLTLRQLTRHRFDLRPDPVYICENPSVLAAAADRCESSAPPMICVNGQPTGAALVLLGAAHRAGAPLWYHGDFDWGGLRIANLVRAHVPWVPWRFDTATYLAATSEAGPLRGRPVEADWDTDLATAMIGRGLRVEEESQLDDLIGDLMR